MRNRPFLKIAVTVLLALTFGSTCYAVGNATTYKVTVQKIQIRRSSDGTWVTIAEPNREIDLAAVNAGAVASSLVSDAPIPVGQYDNFKIVLSETVKFSGADGTNYTLTGGAVTITGADANAASTATWTVFPPNATLSETTESHTTTAGNQGEVTAVLDLDADDADNFMEVYASSNLGTPVTVNADSTVSMSFDFDTQGTIIHESSIMFFTPPQEGTEFGITVDGTSVTISESNMRIDF